MNLSILLRIFKESNIHGFPLIFKSNYHIIERLLWIIVIVTSFYFASNICSNEWQRYQTSPIALFLETNYRDWEYIVPGFTICTHYIDYDRLDNFIYNSLKISKNDSNFEVYKQFVEVITLTTFENLQEFRQFQNKPFLDELDMLYIAKEMREYLLPAAGFNAVITEMGVCFSSTYLHRLQNVSDRIMPTISNENDLCRSTLSELCKLGTDALIELDENIDYKQTLFIHNKDDVMSPTESISQTFAYETIFSIELVINGIVSSEKLKQLLPHQRKCLFESEANLKYFGMYTPNLCKISCRIDDAIKLCGCIPFFYKIKSTGHRVCSIEGMICLSNSSWYQKLSNSTRYEKNCKCLSLCNSYTFQSTIVKSVTSTIYHLISSITVSVKFPKTRIKRGVLYSADNLLVSMGGACGLFVGCSIISIVEFFYFLLEILIDIFMEEVVV